MFFLCSPPSLFTQVAITMMPPKGSRILVAMSGGVDSAVTAALLAEQGYDCYGVTLRLVPEHREKSVFEPCCGLEALEDARRVCEKLGIPFEAMHAVERFDRDIITYFVDEYRSGRTPNPCVRCNRMIKFGAIYTKADELGAGYIAMGHYARLEPLEGRVALRRGADATKDQSYVLAPLAQRQLRRALFPLGGLTKEEVRARAWNLDFGMATKRESQEICFVPDRDYGGYIEGRTGLAGTPGPILSVSGEKLGEHRGLIHYTLGQRRGLGIGALRPYYVVRLDLEKNAVIVGFDEDTLETSFETGVLCWGALRPQDTPFECHVQLRSRHQPVPATLLPSREGARIVLSRPERAITPGQWMVAYDERGYVLCSAIIRGVTVPEAASALGALTANEQNTGTCV